MDCGDDLSCPPGYSCAAVDCFEDFDPDYCGNKCLGGPVEETTTEPELTTVAPTQYPAYRDCEGENDECPDGYICAIGVCETYNPAYCGKKCVFFREKEYPPLRNCDGESDECPTGYVCAIIECTTYDADRCGKKCLVRPTVEPTTERPPLRDCEGPDLSCPQGFACAAIDCIPEYFDPDYCGTKCVGTGE